MHTLLDLRSAIPAVIHVSDGKMHEVDVLDIVPIEAGNTDFVGVGFRENPDLMRLAA